MLLQERARQRQRPHLVFCQGQVDDDFTELPDGDDGALVVEHTHQVPFREGQRAVEPIQDGLHEGNRRVPIHADTAGPLRAPHRLHTRGCGGIQRLMHVCVGEAAVVDAGRRRVVEEVHFFGEETLLLVLLSVRPRDDIFKNHFRQRHRRGNTPLRFQRLIRRRGR